MIKKFLRNIIISSIQQSDTEENICRRKATQNGASGGSSSFNNDYDFSEAPNFLSWQRI